MFWQLLSQARYGFSHGEEAAFVVRGEIGGYRCVAWPSDGFVDSARWVGRFPDGVVAIIHTHPNWMATPSSIDVRTARTARIPVYVITRTQITLTNGDETRIVISGEWKPEMTPRPCSPAATAVARSSRDHKSIAADFHEVEVGH
jgi:proteasome lid subunit RPN8/RPN11